MHHFNRRNYVCLPLDMLRLNVAMLVIPTPGSKKQSWYLSVYFACLTYGGKPTKSMEDPKKDSSLLTLLQ